MKKLLLLLSLLCTSLAPIALGQGVMVPPQTALKVVNGLTTPIANATITVCAANTGGIPCSPALVSAIFKDTALTQPLSNPFTADATGNYQFAIAAGNYTVTVTSLGFAGQSYQITVGGSGSSSCSNCLTDSGANGPLFRNGPGTTRPAVSADIMALFSGTCNVAAYLRGDGSCAPLTVPFSAVTAGTNPNPLVMGSGGSLAPNTAGQIAGSQLWMIPGLVTPVTAIFTTGGSLLNNHSITVVYTFSNSLGETDESGISAAVVSSSCTGTNQCSVVVTSPTVPAGFVGFPITSWTAYGNDATIDTLTFHKIAACTNLAIGTNCTITVIGSGTNPPNFSTAFIAPPNAQNNNGPPGSLPSIYFPKVDGNLYPLLGMNVIDCDPTAGPAGPCGTPVITHRLYANDIGLPTVQYPSQNQTFRNAFISIEHGYGNGTLLTNQDRALGVLGQNTIGDAATHYSMVVAQLENDINGTPGFSAHPDSEAVTLSLQESDNTTGAAGAPVNVGVIRATYSRTNGGGQLGDGGNGVAGIKVGFVNNSSTAFTGGTIWRAYEWNPTGLFANNNNLTQVGNYWNLNTTRSGQANLGTFASANGSGWTPAAGDYFIRQDIHNWNSLLNGNVGLNGILMTDVGTLPVSASVTVTGAVTTAQIASAWTPGYSGTCSGGASSYAYTFVAVDSNGGTSNSAPTNTVNSCTNPLTSGNPITLSVGAAPVTTTFAQAVRIDVYRTSGPMALGKVGSLTCSNDMPVFGCSNFVDTGLAAGAALPSGNTTGGVSAGGDFSFNVSKGQHHNTQAANNDAWGTCTAAAATTCTVTFTRAYASAPACVVTDQTNITTAKGLPSTTTLVITTAAASSDVFSYSCGGNPN